MKKKIESASYTNKDVQDVIKVVTRATDELEAEYGMQFQDINIDGMSIEFTHGIEDPEEVAYYVDEELNPDFFDYVRSGDFETATEMLKAEIITNYEEEYGPIDNIDASKKISKNQKKVYASVDWNYYDKFDKVLEKYMPPRGEGDTLASQAATAVNKLVFKWYNDGDVYDNTHWMEGWANDLSDYANWLYKNIPHTQDILDKIEDCSSESEYENILKDLADYCLDEENLKYFESYSKKGSIYEASGPFRFRDSDEDEDEYEYNEEDDEFGGDPEWGYGQ